MDLYKNDCSQVVWMRPDRIDYFAAHNVQMTIDTSMCEDGPQNASTAVCSRCYWFDMEQAPFAGDPGTVDTNIQAKDCMAGGYNTDDVTSWMRRDRLVHFGRYAALCARPPATGEDTRMV